MDKRYRDDMSMKIAVINHLPASTASTVSPITDAITSQTSKQLGTRKVPLFKRMVRPLARFAYRVAKPFVKPVASRIRRYFAYTPQLLWALDETLATKTLVNEVLQQNQRILQELALAKTADVSMRGTISAQAEALQDLRGALDAAVSTLLGLQEDVKAVAPALASTLLGLQEDVKAVAPTLGPQLARVEAYTLASARRFAINSGADEILIRTEAGYILCPASDAALVAMLVESGDYERGTRLLIERILEPGDVFIDVGANVGMHTLAAARALRGSGHVFAFEPFEPTYRLLRKSIFINGYTKLVDVYQAAVADHTGDHRLFLGQTIAHHSLYPLDLPGASTGSVDVPLVTLDKVLAADPRADLIKIDVEGAELQVLAGAHLIIEANPDVALIVELGPSHLARTGHAVPEWLEPFARLGLVYRVIEPVSGALEDRAPHELAALGGANLLFARPGTAVWRKAQDGYGTHGGTRGSGELQAREGRY